MTAYELGWAAGIIDGEGCIYIGRTSSKQRPNGSYGVYLRVAMGHRGAVERLRVLFGVGAFYEQRSDKYNSAWVWCCTTRQLDHVLRLVRPYLVVKAHEADLALEFMLLPKGKGGSAAGIPAYTVKRRAELFEAMRDAKPSARFRAKKRAV